MIQEMGIDKKLVLAAAEKYKNPDELLNLIFENPGK